MYIPYVVHISGDTHISKYGISIYYTVIFCMQRAVSVARLRKESDILNFGWHVERFFLII